VDITENALVQVDEELNELVTELITVSQSLQKRIFKVLRFGAEETQPGDIFNNAERVQAEFNDLIASVIKLNERGFPIVVDKDLIELKLGKIDRFVAYSEALKTITS